MVKVYILYLTSHSVQSMKVFSSKVRLLNFLRLQKPSKSLNILIEQLSNVKSINIGDCFSVPLNNGYSVRVEARYLDEQITYPQGYYA